MPPGPRFRTRSSSRRRRQQEANVTRARENDALLLYFGIALGIMAVVAAALGWFVAGRALRPLRRITESARRISATNLHERLALEAQTTTCGNWRT